MNTNTYSDELKQKQEEDRQRARKASHINRKINSGIVPAQAEEAEEIEQGER